MDGEYCLVLSGEVGSPKECEMGVQSEHDAHKEAETESKQGTELERMEERKEGRRIYPYRLEL